MTYIKKAHYPLEKDPNNKVIVRCSRCKMTWENMLADTKEKGYEDCKYGIFWKVQK